MIYRFSLIAALVVFIGLLWACNSTDRASLHSPATTTLHPSPAPTLPADNTIHADGVRRVTTVELRDMLAKKEAVVIDVRNEASYKAGHIRGAKLIPHDEILNRLNELPKGKLIVTYCS